MKMHDVLREASDDSGDYQQMLAFTRANRVGGVPDSQQIPLALFKELKKQQQQNQALGRELSDAEKRIDQAMASGELGKQELGLHRGELDRERAAGQKQQAAVGQLSQQYAERERASTEQIQQLTNQLEQVKNKPGVDPEAAKELERQIKELGERSVPVDRLADLEASIEAIQNMQQVDDSAIKDIVAQVKDAQRTTKELQQARDTAGKDAEQAAAAALDQVEQMRQDLERLDQVAGRIATVVTDALPAKIDSLDARLQELDSESEHQYDELLKHDSLLNQLTGQGGSGGVQMEPPESPNKPRPVPSPPSQSYQDQTQQMAQDAIGQAQRSSRQVARAYGQPVIPDPQKELDLEPVSENKMRRAIQWAVGKKL